MRRTKQNTAESISDEEIIDRILSGQKAAYEFIMRKYNRRLYRIARSYIIDEDEIEDVMQETYIKAYEQLARFKKRSSFSTWLTRIAINEALARLNRKKRFTPIAQDRPDDSVPVQERQVQLSNRETPMGTLMNTELRDILEKAVDRLPEKYKSVFLMREIEEMSIAETSQSLEISQTNVKARLSRAKEMLRESISGLYHDKEVFQFNLVRCDRIVQNVLQRLEAFQSPNGMFRTLHPANKRNSRAGLSDKRSH